MSPKAHTHRLIIDGTEEAINHMRYVVAAMELGLMKGIVKQHNVTTIEEDNAGRKKAHRMGESPEAETPEAPKVRNAQVAYVAAVGKDVLEALGKETVKGILFGHILTAGDRGITAAGLRKLTGFTVKSVQSGIDKLQRADGYIRSIPLTVEGIDPQA